MDKIAEKLARLFGSTPFILLHIVGFGSWIIVHRVTGFDDKLANLTVLAGVEVIFLSLFILRAENVQTKRFESDVRKDLGHSKKILKEVHKKTAKK